MAKAYQCSRCALLQDCDEYVRCGVDIDPRPNQREKGDAELCRKSFKALPEKEEWHGKFAWE